MVEMASGIPLRFQLVVQSREQEKVGLHFQRSLAAIGIDMRVRLVDSAQFQRLLSTYDFDMVPYTWYNSLSPGNEQAFYWGSSGREADGTRNYMGAHDPAIDRLIEAMLKAGDQPGFVDAVRALDRTLMAGCYLIPLYNAPGQWLARWSHIKLPATPSLYGFSAASAWYEAQ
jgi:peptide/nickel transport system substrate-binding protein